MSVNSNSSTGGLWNYLQNDVTKRSSVITSGDFLGICNTSSRAESSSLGDNRKPSFFPRVSDGQSKGSETPQTLSFNSCELADLDLNSEAFYNVEFAPSKSNLCLSQDPTSKTVEVEARFRGDDESRFGTSKDGEVEADPFGTSKDGEVEADRFRASKDGDVEGDLSRTSNNNNNAVNRKRRYPADKLPSAKKVARLSLSYFLCSF